MVQISQSSGVCHATCVSLHDVPAMTCPFILQDSWIGRAFDEFLHKKDLITFNSVHGGSKVQDMETDGKLLNYIENKSFLQASHCPEIDTSWPEAFIWHA